MVNTILFQELSVNPDYGVTEAFLYNKKVFSRAIGPKDINYKASNSKGVYHCFVPWQRDVISKLIREKQPHLSKKDVDRATYSSTRFISTL